MIIRNYSLIANQRWTIKRSKTAPISSVNINQNILSKSTINNTDGNVNMTHYRITRAERDKLYQPWIPYVASDLKELDLSFIAESKDDHFNDVYQIMPNDSVVEYECPLGWVFQDSNNISNFAYCRNWT